MGSSSNRYAIIISLFLVFSCKTNTQNKSAINKSDTIVYEYRTQKNQFIEKVVVYNYTEGLSNRKKITAEKSTDSLFYIIDSINISVIKENKQYRMYSFANLNHECNNDTLFSVLFPFNVFMPNYSIKKGEKVYKIKNKALYVYKYRQTDNYNPNSIFWAYYLKGFDFIMYVNEDTKSVFRITDIKGNSTYNNTEIDELYKVIINDTVFFEPKTKPLIPFPKLGEKPLR